MGSIKKTLAAVWESTRNPANRIYFDSAVIFGTAIIVRVITFPLDLFERTADFSRAHEDWELDELLVTFSILSVAFIVFSIRRIFDQRRELTLRKTAERHATTLALQDPLTGLPNRRRFYEALQALPSTGASHALFIIDLDGFKPVNDTFGHATGDEVLRIVAQRLKTLGNSRILAARLGGDEFAVLLSRVRSPAEAEQTAQSIILSIEAPVLAGGVDHRLEVSIGLTIFNKEGSQFDEPMRRADVAMYRAKEEPHSAYFLYNEALDTVLAERIRLERELRAALAADLIVPHYQPIVDLKTMEIVKFEALARWQHPVLGDIPPSRFIELAEERGLIAEITASIARKACRDALDWPNTVVLAINLSPVLLASETFPLQIVKILAEAGFPAGRLGVEITERAFGSNLEGAQIFLNNLRGAGVRISLDDFGTGYSNLSRLRQLPFDEIKIDRSFIQGLTHTEDSAVIVRSIIELARGLGMKLTAEGIEEPAQRDALVLEGCQLGQGYLFDKAMPAHEAAALFVSRPALVVA